MSIRVLIADSDESLLASYRDYLSGSGFEVATATDGLECVERLRDFEPDALVLEPEMPWGGGVGVLAVMLEEPDVPCVPVMVLTCRQDLSALPDVMAFPMVMHYQTKPLPPDQLGRLVRRVAEDLPLTVELRNRFYQSVVGRRPARHSARDGRPSSLRVVR